MNTKLLVLSLMLLCSLPCAADDELVGRLFTTAAERAKLDRMRQKQMDHPADASASRSGAGIDAENNAEPVVDQLTLDGYVTRSSGKNTTWINQNPQVESQRGSLQVVQRPGQAAQVTLLTRDGRHVGIKVGDTLDRVTGKVRKVYEQPPETVAVPEPQSKE